MKSKLCHRRRRTDADSLHPESQQQHATEQAGDHIDDQLKNTNSTKEISRSHKILVAPSRLITITGGKWTTFRRMAQDTVNQAITTGGLPAAECVTKDLHIHGYTEHPSTTEPLNVYGSDAPLLQTLIAQQAELGQPLDARLPYIKAQVIWAVRNEMARTVEDVLARRLRALFLDAQAAIDMAPQVAALMAAELGKDNSWQQAQVQAFKNMAQHYLLQRSNTIHKITA